MHLIGFTVRICHDARSPERQIRIALSRYKPEGSADTRDVLAHLFGIIEGCLII